MTEKNVNVRITGDNSGFMAALRGVAPRLQAFGEQVRGTASGINRYLDAAATHFSTFGTAMTALTTGAIVKKLFSLEDFIPIDRALLVMQSNLRVGTREMGAFREQLASFAGSAGADITEVFKTATKLSYAYQPDQIMKVLSASTEVAHATGSSLEEASARVTQILKMYHRAPEEAQAVANAIIASRADLESLDTLLQRGVIKGATGDDYRDFLAIIGGLKKAGIENARVINTVEGAFANMFEKAAMLKSVGIDLFRIDPATGKKVRKGYIEILDELDRLLNTKYKHLSKDQVITGLNKAFGEGSGEGITFLISQLDKLKKAKEDQANASEIASRRLAAIDDTWGKKLEQVKGHLAAIKTDFSWAYNLGKKPVSFLAESPKLTKGLAEGAAAVSLAIGGGILFKKGKGFLSAIGKTAAGVAEGKALEAAAGVTPVFVTNWPAGGVIPGIPNGPIPLPAGGSGMGRAGKAFASATVYGGIALGMYETANWLSDISKDNQFPTYSPETQATMREVMGVAGKRTGGAPVVKNEINATIIVDPKRTTVTTDDLNTQVTVEQRRGKF